MSAAVLLKKSIPSKMNSDALSRDLDAKAGLQDYVRLSFCSNDPMMHVAKKENRIGTPVLLRVHLDALFRPGAKFSDCNATRRDASIADTPTQVCLALTTQQSAFDVPTHLRKFYQAEVLVPSPVPAEFIIFPKTDLPT